MTTHLPPQAPGGPPSPVRTVILFALLLIVGGALVAVAIAWPMCGPACEIVAALLIVVLQEIHDRPPRS